MFNSLVLYLAMHCGLLNLEQQDRGCKQYADVFNYRRTLQYFLEISRRGRQDAQFSGHVLHIISLHYHHSGLTATKLNGTLIKILFYLPVSGLAILLILPRMFEITLRSLSRYVSVMLRFE